MAPTNVSKVFKICGQNFSAKESLLAAHVLQCMFDKAEKLVQRVPIISVLRLAQEMPN